MTTRMHDLLARAREQLRYEPIERRVRADDVVDTTRAVLVWEPGRVVPSFAVPEEDIAVTPVPAPAQTGEVPDVLHPGIPFALHTAPGMPVSIGARAGAGFRLADEALAGYVELDFRAFEAWYEEDERIFGHPRDPFSRIDVRRSARPVRIEIDGEVLADTRRARMLWETGLYTRFYLPREDVAGVLVGSERTTYCPYKGQASYWSLGRHRDICWSYEDPLPDLAFMRGLVAFWNERVDVFVDGVRREPPRGPIAEAMRKEFAV